VVRAGGTCGWYVRMVRADGMRERATRVRVGEEVGLSRERGTES
jgi:hypothetical protein